MQEYLYNNYVQKLSQRFKSQLESIEAGFNFDYGPEFEVALCRILGSTLPQKFGICRGFVVDSKGQLAGDDIIIFAQDRFFTLRQGAGLDLAVKEQIPIEAAYAYIEAKHTLVLEGEGGSSLHKAFEQVKKVKNICTQRAPVDLIGYDPYVQNFPLRVEPSIEYKTRNHMFGGIFARHVRRNESSPILNDPSEIDKLIKGVIERHNFEKDFSPDLIVAGDSNVVVPAIKNSDQIVYAQFMSREKIYGTRTVEGRAYGIGLLCLSFALDWIRLGKMPWDELIADAMALPLKDI